MKQLGTFALAAALTGSLLTPALAAGYATSITVNGTALDTSALPEAQGLPLRLVAEADHGSASWFAEENSSSFYFSKHRVEVSFQDGSITVDDNLVEDAVAQVVDGVTFVPTTVLDGLDGITLEETEAGVSITTPNNSPLVKLAYEVADAGGVGYGMAVDAESLDTYGVHSDSFTEAAGFFPMITSPDTIIIGKLAEGKEEQAKADLEAYRQQQEDTFSWYLSQNLPKVQDARTVVKDGYFLFVIAENADEAVAAFESGLAGLEG